MTALSVISRSLVVGKWRDLADTVSTNRPVNACRGELRTCTTDSSIVTATAKVTTYLFVSYCIPSDYTGQ